MTEIAVGSATAAPGEIATGRIEVTAMAGGAPLGIPVIVVNGAKDGPCLWIDGVIHGDEPEGTLMCHLLRHEVDPATLAGTLVLVPVMNTGAFEAGRRGNPLDTFSYDMKPMSAGDTIARIFDVYGEEVGKISAPADGMFFGVRCLPSVMTGDWCCFYAKLDAPGMTSPAGTPAVRIRSASSDMRRTVAEGGNGTRGGQRGTARASGLARLLDHVRECGDVWVTTRGAIAHHWLRHHPPRAG